MARKRKPVITNPVAPPRAEVTPLTFPEALGRVHQGDCVQGLAGLPAQSVDLAFADPPFNIGYDYDVYDDRQERQAYLDWSRKWIAGVHRALKPDGAFWLAIGDEYAAELKLLSQEVGFHCRSWVVWYYTFGVNCKQKFTRSHAHLFYFVKDPKRFTFLHELPENRIPSARQLVYGDNRANPQGRLPDDTWILRPQDLADCLTPNEDTWYFPRVAGTFKERAGFHGCQMPEQLLGRIIRGCSRPGEIVLDPFSGSATTLVVARKLGRLCLGFELSPEYVARGQSRLDGVCQGDALDGAAEPLVSAPSTPTDPSQKRGRKTAPVVSGHELRTAEKIAHMTAAGVRDAFRQAAEGFSVDRLVADPDLSAAFHAACRQKGLAGDARSWNRLLFRLRKAGQLSGIPTARRTETTWHDCDRYVFASEMAWRQLVLEGAAQSLDEILCEPELAARFDALAAELAPGFSPREYRWAALMLRKQASTARTRAGQFAPVRLGQPAPVDAQLLKKTGSHAGVYLVTHQGRTPLYAGESFNLGDRLQRQMGPASRWPAGAATDDLRVSFFATEAAPAVLFAYQSQLVTAHLPQFNLPDLAAV